jgi:transcriptional regulator with XRE-family HTH domain
MTGSDEAKDLLAGVRAEDRTGGAAAPSTAGALLRKWRQRRQLTQLDVAARSAVSARYLSFIENGRSRPSREMVSHLAQRLDIPPRDRNHLLLAAGIPGLEPVTPSFSVTPSLSTLGNVRTRAVLFA